MWERGQRVIVFSGHIDASGTRTDVQLGTIEEVGEFELMIKFSNRSWEDAKRISVERCMPIIRAFHVPNPIPDPEVGDLILARSWKYSLKEAKNIIGTVHSISYSTSESYAEIMVDEEVKKVPLTDCFILQRPPKKTEESDQACYISNVTKNQKDPHEKIERTKTLPGRKPPPEL